MSTRVCILCEKRQCDTANSFYSFPKDPMLQAKWKYVCSIEDNVVVNNLKVCSEYFDITAFVETGISGQRGILRLKTGAIPKGITNIETTVNEDNTSIMEDEEEHSTITEKMSESINVEGNCIVTEMISDLLINNEEESLVGM
ncbi:hypothetical protein ABEB36_013523 [Hypothenemus hampei]|uniref:THAP-type domain-containing protein n=1 Tax=Hypothenemus hampei TaxID=57062 RepID=A0ABD1E4R8_HYPHA